MQGISVEQRIFGAVIAATGLVGLVAGDFAPIWLGVAKTHAFAPALAAVTAIVAVVGGLALLWRRISFAGAWALFACLMLWLVLVRGALIVRAPLNELSYQNFGMTAVLVAAAWMILIDSAGDRPPPWLYGRIARYAAAVLYAAALLAFGLSHFCYLEFTAPLVPHWLPYPVGWAYLTGAAYLAAGAAILTGVLARPAAILVAAQMTGFLLLIWLPMLAAGGISAFHWTELVNTAVLSAAGWVIARAYTPAR